MKFTTSNLLDISYLKSEFEKNPFCENLGLILIDCNEDGLIAEFTKRDHLVGNVDRKLLHGGVISGVMDHATSTASATAVIRSMIDKPIDEVFPRIMKLVTANLRIDYIAPCSATDYVVKANIVKLGSRHIVCRGELEDTSANLLAVAIGSFIY